MHAIELYNELKKAISIILISPNSYENFVKCMVEINLEEVILLPKYQYTNLFIYLFNFITICPKPLAIGIIFSSDLIFDMIEFYNAEINTYNDNCLLKMNEIILNLICKGNINLHLCDLINKEIENSVKLHPDNSLNLLKNIIKQMK